MKACRVITHCIFLCGILLALDASAQNDSIIFNNGNYIIGETKGMDRNVLTVETDFSDSDFKIEWDGVSEIYSETYFLITLADGRRYNGTIVTTAPGKIKIVTDEELTVEVKNSDIVFLNSVDKGFWSQFYASIDIGIDLTKAKNFRQYSMRSNVGYLAERWSLDLNYNSLYSEQDDVDPIKRRDGGFNFKYYLPNDWFATTGMTFLSNTEQKIQLRNTANLGMGKFVIHTNRTYWAFMAGASNNNENFSDTTADRNSWEGFLGTELNMFNVGDLNLMTSIIAYPSFTESGRWRSDFKFDLKYDLPLDFYIKYNITFNYDNRPVAGAPELDYVMYFGFGWEW